MYYFTSHNHEFQIHNHTCGKVGALSIMGSVMIVYLTKQWHLVVKKGISVTVLKELISPLAQLVFSFLQSQ